MKTSLHQKLVRRVPALVVAGAMLFPPFASLSSAAEKGEASKPAVDVIERTRRMRDEMSRRFHQSWKELRDSVEARSRSGISVATASVDLREQNDGYTLRLHLPGHDVTKVEVTLEQGNQLHITAPAGDKAGRYEQTIVLGGVASDAKPKIETKRKEHLVIVQIPKAATAAPPEPKAEPSPPKTLAPPADRWDRDLLESMEHMRREMDQIFRDGFDRLGDMPEFKDIFDEARFGSSVELQEQDGNYVVRAYLPDRDAENVKVVVEDGRILKIDAVAEETTDKTNDGLILKRKASYSQRITLPGPVDPDKLAVDRKQDMLVITVPKISRG